MTEQRTPKAWTFKQTLLLSVLPIVLSNAGQWVTTRAKSETRDEHLLRAFTSSVGALDSARAVVESAEARLRACEEARGFKAAPGRATALPPAPEPAPEVMMMREDDLQVAGTENKGTHLSRGGDAFSRALRWLTTPSHATAVLDSIAQQEAK